MSRWKVLAATPFLLIPLALAGISLGDGIEHRGSRPTVVLPSRAEGPQVTMRPTSTDKADPGKPDRDGPGPDRPDPPREAELTCTQDDDDDDDRDDDDVEVVQPCPDAVGDDDDDDGEHDGDDADGDD